MKETLEHLVQLSHAAEQNEMGDANDLPKVTGFLVVELKLPSGFFCNIKSCKSVDNKHFCVQFAELKMVANTLAGILVSWIKNLNVYTFLGTIPKEKVRSVYQSKWILSFITLCLT